MTARRTACTAASSRDTELAPIAAIGGRDASICEDCLEEPRVARTHVGPEHLGLGRVRRAEDRSPFLSHGGVTVTHAAGRSARAKVGCRGEKAGPAGVIRARP